MSGQKRPIDKVQTLDNGMVQVELFEMVEKEQVAHNEWKGKISGGYNFTIRVDEGADEVLVYIDNSLYWWTSVTSSPSLNYIAKLMARDNIRVEFP